MSRRETLFWIILFVIGASLLVSIPLTFGTKGYTCLVTNPTEEQVYILLAGNPENRVWFDDTSQVMSNSYILVITYRARLYESERVEGFLNKLGVEYRFLRKGE